MPSKVTCRPPSGRFTVPRWLATSGDAAGSLPDEASSGGQTDAQLPVHVIVPFVSLGRWYRVRPLGACRTTPNPEIDPAASCPILPMPFPPVDPVVDDLLPHAASTMAAPTNTPKIPVLLRIPIISGPPYRCLRSHRVLARSTGER